MNLVIAAALAALSPGPLDTDIPKPPRPPAHILLVGTFHFSDKGLDSYRPEHDVDILSKERQKELDELLDCLESFAPSRIALEFPPARHEEINEQYRKYLAGELELTSNEIHQIGFRLAERAGLGQVHGIDAARRFYDPYVDPTEYAIEHGQAERLLTSETPWEEYYTRLYQHADRHKMVHPLKEHFLFINDPRRVMLTHGHYLVGTFKAGVGTDYPGVDAKVAWYNRNLRIFANIQRITESPGDRILVLIGAGHLPILRHAAEASPEYALVEVSTVLSPKCEAPE